VVPFADQDGVEDGDQGNRRKPRDHNRDHNRESPYAETAALRDLVPRWSGGRLAVAVDLHCPWVRGRPHEQIQQVGSADAVPWAQQQQQFGRLLESGRRGPLAHSQANDLPFGRTGTSRRRASWGSRRPAGRAGF
jgi:hypothetical protein